MPSLPPVPPAGQSPFGPEGVPKTFEDVSHRVRAQAQRHARDEATRNDEPPTSVRSAPTLDARVPVVGIALATMIGYALGTVVHRKLRQSKAAV